MKNILLFLLFWSSCNLFAQKIDSIKTKELKEIMVKGYKSVFQEVKQLESVHQTFITTGKKHEVINIQDLPANIAEKTGRQIFAKISGAFIYDMDGSGNQINIATRGLDPHRSWEYNTRQNGIMTNSDIYGYPASHYSPPMEAIARIELIRGAASLQYGAQFGGMINYVVKKADTTQKIGFENINSIGSFGLFSSYNAISGTLGKVSYYAYYQKRISEGYRQNARSEAQSQYVSLNYAFSPSLNLRAELGRSQYLYKIPGPLTDSMFYANPRQSTRSRNYFNPDIYIPSLTLDWQLSPKTKISWITSAVLGDRNSVQFINFANVIDELDSLSLQYKPRQVDLDHFHSYTGEWRIQQNYRIGRTDHVLISGIRYINNNLHRQQLGKGTTGTDFDLSLTEPNFDRDIYFKTQNLAFFIENLFCLSAKFQLSPGFRVEKGVSRMSGHIKYLPQNQIPQNIDHQFILFGLSSQYQLDKNNKIYGSWSQAYRPVIFSDIIPPTSFDLTDQNIKNAFGYNAEIGIKGQLKNHLIYDLTFFRILYKNRIGSLALINDNGQYYIWKTNIGNSLTQGIELYLEATIFENFQHKISVFSASSYFNAHYLNGEIRDGNDNKNITNNRLETVPKWISRNGLQMGYKAFAAILQYNYVAKSYSDALNTERPSANGARGIVPSYGIWDLNVSCRINGNYMLRFGCNNLTNKQYFTKRPTGYPGQGVWNSDGRSIVISFGIKI